MIPLRPLFRKGDAHPDRYRVKREGVAVDLTAGSPTVKAALLNATTKAALIAEKSLTMPDNGSDWASGWVEKLFTAAETNAIASGSQDVVVRITLVYGTDRYPTDDILGRFEAL